jgi:putative FmdB family regulatory protein
MPIYDYACRACDARFELLVRASTTPACPACRSEDLERLLSLPAIRSDATRDVVRRETSRRDATQARDRVNEQRRYERNHD